MIRFAFEGLPLLHARGIFAQCEDRVLQFVYCEGFGEVVINAEGLGLLNVLRLSRGSEDDDLHVLFVGKGKLMQGADEVEAVDQWHVQIEQDDVGRGGGAFANASEKIERSTTVVHRVDLLEKSARLGYTYVDVAADLVVVNN